MSDSRAPDGTQKKPRAEAPPGVPSAFDLAVVEGPDAGLVFTLDPSLPRILVGKSPACSLRLADPMVSRRHAALDVVGHRVRVFDLDSTNGTTVNGVTIKEVVLTGGETIALGETTIAVRRKGPRMVELPKATKFGGIAGESAAMRKLYPVFERIAGEAGPVLLEGEKGVGKELLAEEIHRASARRDTPFVVVACTESAEGALETALRDALRDAKGGTVYIDELGDLGTGAQRALLEGAGEARIIGATTRDLDKAVDEGTFDESLFKWLAGSRIELPPLRDRLGDVALLARRFWVELGGNGALPADFLARVAAHRWPGNIDELRSSVVKRVASAPEGGAPSATPDEPDLLAAIATSDMPFSRARQALIDEFERRYVANILAKHNGSVSRAAAASGLALRYFQLLKARH